MSLFMSLPPPHLPPINTLSPYGVTNPPMSKQSGENPAVPFHISATDT